MGITGGGYQSRAGNPAEAVAEIFLGNGASPKTPGLDKPECGAKTREGELGDEPSQE